MQQIFDETFENMKEIKKIKEEYCQTDTIIDYKEMGLK